MLNEFALNRTADLAADCVERERKRARERGEGERKTNIFDRLTGGICFLISAGALLRSPCEYI